MMYHIENKIIYFNYDSYHKNLTILLDSYTFDKIYSYRKAIDDIIVKQNLVYKNIPSDCDQLDELYLINDFDQHIFFTSLVSLISRVDEYPRNKKILNTNFKSHTKEIMTELTNKEFIFYTEDEVKQKFHNKWIHIKNLYYSDNNYQFNGCECDEKTKLINLELCSNAFYRNKVFISREDAQFGHERVLTNKNEVKSIFQKNGFLIIDSLSKYNFFEKSIILNYFDTIVFEGGAGVTNLFLLKNKNKQIYSIDPPTYHPCEGSKSVGITIKCLSIGYIDDTHELYNKSSDNLNQPWKIDLNRLNEFLTTI